MRFLGSAKMRAMLTGTGRPRNWIAADIVRIADGVLAEHRDVLPDEAIREESQGGRPMFGTEFAA